MIPWEEETNTSLKEVLAEGIHPHLFPPPSRGRVREGGELLSLPETEGLCRKVMIFIGPEGGFTREEIASARKHGVVPVSLGSRVFRSETAAIASVAILVHELG